MNGPLDLDGTSVGSTIQLRARSFPSTPSPTSFYRRPSAASSCSWETSLSSYSSELSLQSPLTPVGDGVTSPADLFMPEGASLFPSVGGDLAATVPQAFHSPFGMAGERGEGLPGKEYSFMMNTSAFTSFEDMALPPPQPAQESAGSSLYEVPSYRFDGGSSAFYELSSPVDQWSSPAAAGMAGAAPATTTVMPSQTLSAPRTPQSTARTASQVTGKGRGADEAIPYGSFTTPSPSISATSSGLAESWTCTSPYGASSQAPSAAGRATRAKARLSDGEGEGVVRKWVPRFIYPRNEKKHKCRHPGCTGAFQRQEHLKRHETSHTGDRPHECRVAGCKFKGSRSDNLKQHMKRHRMRGGRVKYVPDLVID